MLPKRRFRGPKSGTTDSRSLDRHRTGLPGFFGACGQVCKSPQGFSKVYACFLYGCCRTTEDEALNARILQTSSEVSGQIWSDRWVAFQIMSLLGSSDCVGLLRATIDRRAFKEEPNTRGDLLAPAQLTKG